MGVSMDEDLNTNGRPINKHIELRIKDAATFYMEAYPVKES